MLNLIVKGERFEAARAAANRAIPAAFVREVGMSGYRNTVMQAGEQHLDKVVRWIAEPGEVVPGFGFPNGTLLLYNHGGYGLAREGA